MWNSILVKYISVAKHSSCTISEDGSGMHENRFIHWYSEVPYQPFLAHTHVSRAECLLCSFPRSPRSAIPLVWHLLVSLVLSDNSTDGLFWLFLVVLSDNSTDSTDWLFLRLLKTQNSPKDGSLESGCENRLEPLKSAKICAKSHVWVWFWYIFITFRNKTMLHGRSSLRSFVADCFRQIKGALWQSFSVPKDYSIYLLYAQDTHRGADACTSER